jgi:hypothetical protein
MFWGSVSLPASSDHWFPRFPSRAVRKCSSRTLSGWERNNIPIGQTVTKQYL